MRKSRSDRLHGGQFVQYDEEGLQRRTKVAPGPGIRRASAPSSFSPLLSRAAYRTVRNRLLFIAFRLTDIRIQPARTTSLVTHEHTNLALLPSRYPALT